MGVVLVAQVYVRVIAVMLLEGNFMGPDVGRAVETEARDEGVRLRDVLTDVDLTPSLRPLLGSVCSNSYG